MSNEMWKLGALDAFLKIAKGISVPGLAAHMTDMAAKKAQKFTPGMRKGLGPEKIREAAIAMRKAKGRGTPTKVPSYAEKTQIGRPKPKPAPGTTGAAEALGL